MTSTIGEILPVAARRFGTRTALVVGDRSFPFEVLGGLLSRAAHGLVAAGVQPGDRVALYGPNCWEWLVAYYAIAKTGAVGIPVNVMLTAAGVRFVVGASGPQGRGRFGRQGRAVARSARDRKARGRRPVGRRDPVRR